MIVVVVVKIWFVALLSRAAYINHFKIRWISKWMNDPKLSDREEKIRTRAAHDFDSHTISAHEIHTRIVSESENESQSTSSIHEHIIWMIVLFVLLPSFFYSLLCYSFHFIARAHSNPYISNWICYLYPSCHFMCFCCLFSYWFFFSYTYFAACTPRLNCFCV